LRKCSRQGRRPEDLLVRGLSRSFRRSSAVMRTRWTTFAHAVCPRRAPRIEISCRSAAAKLPCGSARTVDGVRRRLLEAEPVTPGSPWARRKTMRRRPRASSTTTG
jgi:hypothetical protein